MPPSQAERQIRLSQLARFADVDTGEPPGKLCPPKARQPLVISRRDRYEAQRLIDEASRKGRTLSILHRHAGLRPHLYKHEHVGKALSDHVQNHGSATIAQALVDCLRRAKWSDSKSSTLKTITLQSGLLTFATRTSNIDLVNVFAAHADSQELDAALEVATENNDRVIQSLLLQCGADPNCLRDYLVRAITSNDTNMVTLLLRQRKPLRSEVHEDCLKAAVEAANLRALTFLLKTPVVVRRSEKGTSLGWARDMLLHMTIQRDQYKMFVTLAYHTAAHALYDSTLYSHILTRYRNYPDLAISMTEVLLCLDVSATCASKFWKGNPLPFNDRAVDPRLLWLLVSYEVPVSYQAFQLAGEAGRLDIFTALLNHHVEDGRIVWNSVGLLPTEQHKVAREHVIVKLAQENVKGDGWANDALIYAAKLENPDWIALLLDLEASANHNNSEAIKIAVENQNETIYKLLMRRPISYEAERELMPLIMRLSPEVRLSFLKEFLNQAYHDSVITPVLDEALCDSKNQETELINLLIDSEARCSWQGMAAVVDNGEVEILNRFLTVQKRQIHRRVTSNSRDHFPYFVCGNMQFLVDRLEDIREPKFRQLCLQMLDVHISRRAAVNRIFRFDEYFDLMRALKKVGPTVELVNLFGKYQRYLPLNQQAQITGVIVCSQPLPIAYAFVDLLCQAIRCNPVNHSEEFVNIALHVAGQFFADDAEKSHKWAYVLESGINIAFPSSILSAKCLEAHLKSLANASESCKWPTHTTRLLLRRIMELDHYFYSCVRISCMHEQIETLRTLFSIVPKTEYVGGDLLRPLLRYSKMASLQYLLAHWTSPALIQLAFNHAASFGLTDVAVLILKFATVHLSNAKCRCLKGVALCHDKALVEALISRGYFSSDEEGHFWNHLDPQPFQAEKHGTFSVLLRGQPNRCLVQQLFARAAEAEDVYLCHLILTRGTCIPRAKPEANALCCTTQVIQPAPPGKCPNSSLIDEMSVYVAFKCAVEKGNIDLCNLLLDHGAPIEFNNYLVLRSIIESGTPRDLDILASILDRIKSELRPRILNECLWRATVFNKKLTCAWLLQKSASPLVKGYGPLRTAADRGLVEVLNMFIQQNLPQEALAAAFVSSQSTSLRTSVPHEQRLQVARILVDAGVKDSTLLSEALINIAGESNPPTALAKLLLESGASVTHQHSQCLIEAWRAGHVWLLRLLCYGHRQLSTAAHCFRQACADYYRCRPKDVDMLEIVAFIVGLGVPQLILDAELSSALETSLSVSKEWNMRLVHLLVNRGAALDPTSAKSLFHACLSGDEVFVRTAMRYGPTRETRILALNVLFSEDSKGPESDLSCMNLLFSHGDVVNAIDCDSLVGMIKSILLTRKTMPLLYSLLSKRRPGGKKNDCLGRALCSNPQQLRDLLHWAIILASHQVSSSCISGLIRCIFFEEELNVGPVLRSGTLAATLWAPTSQSLLLLALKHGRPSLIPVMIHSGASSTVKDSSGKSALSLAIEKRYVRAADSLFSAGTQINDGSLHAAACVQDLDMIRRLREQGHTPTSRPASYGGHTVLESFLRHHHLDEKQLGATVKALTGGIEKPGLWVASPGHIWVALRSKAPYALTVALLDNMPRQKRKVDDLYLWKRKYYSALCWVLKDKCPHLIPQLKPNLVRYLENAGFQQVFYAIDGPQPYDAAGVPPYLLEKENDRQRRQAYCEKECAVCGDKPEDYASIYAQINHGCLNTHSWQDKIICTGCLTGHIMAQIFPEGVQNRACSGPRCWAPGCQATLSHSEVKQYLSDAALFSQYDEKLTLQLLHSNSQSARCANTAINCRGGAWFSDADLEELTFFRCQVCEQLTCLQCNNLYEPSHLSAPCPVGLKQKRDEEDEQSDETARKISRECGCGARIQKTEGCDHMTCNQCGSEWCYECLVPYDQIRGGDNSAHLPTYVGIEMISSKLQQIDLPFLVKVPWDASQSLTPSVFLFLLVASLSLYFAICEVRRLHARLPGIRGPTGLPIVGNLHQLGPDPAERLRRWGKKYGGIYQISMGDMPVVVFNSMQAAKDVFIGQGGALVDRPRFYSFHAVLSRVASSIGTSPWSESIKRRRKAVASAMNRPATASYIPFIDELTCDFIINLLERGNSGAVAFDPKPSIQHTVLDLTTTVNYGVRLPKDEALFSEITYVEHNVSRFRSTTGALQDYIPILRWNPINKKSAHAREINRRRLIYLNRFNHELEERMKTGTDKPCIQGNVRRDPEAKMNELELLSISMTMVTGGLGTMVNTLAWTIGTLARRRDVQDSAYAAVSEVYGKDYSNWARTAEEENGVPYIKALVKECLRYISVLRMSLPRTAWKDIDYRGIHIPKGTTVFLNAWGLNRDEDVFGSDVDAFRPDRYLDADENDDGVSPSRLDHATYGFGTRMCAGSHVANRQLYITILRLVWAFRIELSDDPRENEWSIDPLKDVTEPYHLTAIPPRYKVRFVPRHEDALTEALEVELKA